MKKDKNPRKKEKPSKDKNLAGEAEFERQTQENAELVPPWGMNLSSARRSLSAIR